jgi:hypothetical protein
VCIRLALESHVFIFLSQKLEFSKLAFRSSTKNIDLFFIFKPKHQIEKNFRRLQYTVDYSFLKRERERNVNLILKMTIHQFEIIHHVQHEPSDRPTFLAVSERFRS